MRLEDVMPCCGVPVHSPSLPHTHPRACVDALRDHISGLRDEAAAWRVLALEAALIDPVMHGLGMCRCAFCREPAAIGRAIKHAPGCLTERVRRLRDQDGDYFLPEAAER